MKKFSVFLAGILTLGATTVSAQDCGKEQTQEARITCLSRRVEALQKQIDLLAKSKDTVKIDSSVERLIDDKISRAMKEFDNKLKKMTEPRLQRVPTAE